jgi:hypothetical protein
MSANLNDGVCHKSLISQHAVIHCLSAFQLAVAIGFGCRFMWVVSQVACFYACTFGPTDLFQTFCTRQTVRNPWPDYAFFGSAAGCSLSPDWPQIRMLCPATADSQLLVLGPRLDGIASSQAVAGKQNLISYRRMPIIIFNGERPWNSASRLAGRLQNDTQRIVHYLNGGVVGKVPEGVLQPGDESCSDRRIGVTVRPDRRAGRLTTLLAFMIQLCDVFHVCAPCSADIVV